MKPLTAALAVLLAAAPAPLLAQQPASATRPSAPPPLSPPARAPVPRPTSDAELQRANNAIRQGWKAATPSSGVRLGQHAGAPAPGGLQTAGGIPAPPRPDSSRRRSWGGHRQH